MPFALVDRPDDTWYRLHLDTDDDLYEVDMVRAGHRATAASMKGAAAKRRRLRRVDQGGPGRVASMKGAAAKRRRQAAWPAPKTVSATPQ